MFDWTSARPGFGPSGAASGSRDARIRRCHRLWSGAGPDPKISILIIVVRERGGAAEAARVSLGVDAVRLAGFPRLTGLGLVPVEDPVDGAIADAEPLRSLVDRQTFLPDDGAPLPVHLPAFPGHGPGQPAAVSHHAGWRAVRLLRGRVMRVSQRVEEFSAVQARDVGAVPVLAAGQGSAALGAGAEFPGRLFWFQVVSPGICVLTVGSGGSGRCSAAMGRVMALTVRYAAMRDGASPALGPGRRRAGTASWARLQAGDVVRRR